MPSIFSQPILRDGAGAPPQNEVFTSGTKLDPHGEEPDEALAETGVFGTTLRIAGRTMRPTEEIAGALLFEKSNPSAHSERLTVIGVRWRGPGVARRPEEV
jgi:hypothetical protein